MARIRSIKPELLEDERAARLQHAEWRLFVSLILLADDYGNFRAAPERVHGAALWAHRQEDAAALLSALQAAGLILLYEVDRQRYGHLRGWDKHQKVDHPGKPLCPPPPVREATVDESRGSREGLAKESEGLAPDLDLDQEIDQDRDPPAPAIPPTAEPEPVPPPASRPPALWDALAWCRRFGSAWCGAFNRAAYGKGESDAKAQARLTDELTGMSEAERRAAEDRAPELFARYFADDDPKARSAGHSFAFFVPRFQGLLLRPPGGARAGPGRPQTAEERLPGIRILG